MKFLIQLPNSPDDFGVSLLIGTNIGLNHVSARSTINQWRDKKPETRRGVLYFACASTAYSRVWEEIRERVGVGATIPSYTPLLPLLPPGIQFRGGCEGGRGVRISKVRVRLLNINVSFLKKKKG